ncbi:Transcriptional regulator PerR [Fundidesulfovibrio magnetotacticus]|uniref:Transcriptional regulator PerR n=1 Tax=Fundidesulfovibrio magnetotacticus TaxID=2730080 RepID=A0A6V8LYA8_9BACT|nr:transcriptional repressor [Fundidesulfovibrio magnetotacticus]GFK94637.1 Transcriptional regulator PerR [Fundidesulfovibrio magnetotacticus]
MCSACDAARLLAASELRATPRRLRVLQAVLDAEEALAPPALLAALRREAPMDKVTLYRCLEALHHAGLIQRHDAGDGSVRYCAGGPGHPEHHHFHCLRCRRLLCLEPGTVRVGVDLPGVVHVDVRLEGVCPACAS